MKRKIKQFMSLLMSLLMVMCMSFPVMAADGSITITQAVPGESYSIYKLFDMTYGGTQSDGVWETYSYSVTGEWEEFFKSGDGASYFTFAYGTDGKMYVVDNSLNDNNIEAFTKSALEYANDHSSVSATRTQTAPASQTGTVTLTFSGLDYGYYLVDTTVGSLCMLTSTDPTASIEEKNPTPTIEKEVRDMTHKEDGTAGEEEWAEEDNADIGDELEFEVFIESVAHSSNLCMHDVLSQGLTFEPDTVLVYLGYPSDNALKDLYADTTTSWNQISPGQSTWTEAEGCTDGCTFELSFDDDWLDGLNDGAVIKVLYKAEVNDKAEEHNTNDVQLSFGISSWSVKIETITDVFGFTLVKVNEFDEQLEHAGFTLKDASGNSIDFTYADGTYTVDDTSGSLSTNTVIDVGSARIFGLEAGEYILTEIEAPAGYNRLTYSIAIQIDEAGNVYVLNLSDNEGFDDVEWDMNNAAWESLADSDHTLKVVNNTGNILPKMGGAGTVMLYVSGIILMAGACVALLVKSRTKK